MYTTFAYCYFTVHSMLVPHSFIDTAWHGPCAAFCTSVWGGLSALYWERPAAGSTLQLCSAKQTQPCPALYLSIYDLCPPHAVLTWAWDVVDGWLKCSTCGLLQRALDVSAGVRPEDWCLLWVWLGFPALLPYWSLTGKQPHIIHSLKPGMTGIYELKYYEMFLKNSYKQGKNNT